MEKEEFLEYIKDKKLDRELIRNLEVISLTKIDVIYEVVGALYAKAKRITCDEALDKMDENMRSKLSSMFFEESKSDEK